MLDFIANHWDLVWAILASAFLLFSEALSLNPRVKSNGVLQAILNALRGRIDPDRPPNFPFRPA